MMHTKAIAVVNESIGCWKKKIKQIAFYSWILEG